MRQWNRKVKVTKYEASVVGMLLLTLVPTFWLLRIQIKRDINAGTMNNFRIYVVAALFFAGLLLASSIICKLLLKEMKISCLWYLLYVTLFLCNIKLLADCYVNSSDIYPHLSEQWFPWHAKTQWKMFVFMLAFSLVGILVFFWTNRKKVGLIEWLRYPMYLLAAGVAGVSMYSPNFLAGDAMHGNAYYTSIYNALMDAPYDYSNQSIYGHYAILLKYPIKLLGGNYIAYNIVISIIGALSIFFVALALDLCLNNHFISIIGAWSIPVMYLYYPKNHWQMFPHRVLFAGITIYLLALYFHKKIKWIKPVGYIVGMLSLIWNVETGIVCLGTWCLACIVQEAFGENMVFSWKNTMKGTLHNIVYSIIAVWGMVLLFNLYNMPLGEKWHGLRFTLFPLDSGWDTPEVLIAHAQETGEVVDKSGLEKVWENINTGFASGLTIQLPYEISPWYFVFLLMGIAIVTMVARMLYRRVEANDYVMGFAAVLALGQLIYFFNRPCFDYLAIGFFEAVLILAILIEDRVTRRTIWVKRPYQFMFVAILSVLSVLTIWQTHYRILERYEAGYYDRTKFDGVIKEIRKEVPEDTFAFGQGIQEIYAQLGWDTGCYIIDWSSLGNTDSFGKLTIQASQQKELMVSARIGRSNEHKNIEQIMFEMGFEKEAIEVKEHWQLDVDENAYWDLYYVVMDQNYGNRLLSHYEKMSQERQEKNGAEW